MRITRHATIARDVADDRFEISARFRWTLFLLEAA